jgi:hypothetical protein
LQLDDVEFFDLFAGGVARVCLSNGVDLAFLLRLLRWVACDLARRE